MEAPAGKGEKHASIRYLRDVQERFVTRFLSNPAVRKVRRWLPRRNFRTIHWMCFLVWSLISTILLLIFQHRLGRVPAIDCLFLAVSSVTGTGLAPLNISSLGTFEQVNLFLNFIIGSGPMTSLGILLVRKSYMKDTFKDFIAEKRRCEEELEAAAKIVNPKESIATTPNPTAVSSEGSETKLDSAAVFPNHALPASQNLQKEVKGWRFLYKDFLNKATIGRNSGFHGLTRQERESIACVEYNAVVLILHVVWIYCAVLQIVGGISLGWYFNVNKGDFIRGRGVNPWWNGLFNSMSAFNNAGMSLMDDSMVSFKTAAFPTAVMSFLMLAGNTGFPIFLRLILWVMLKLLPRNAYWDDTRATLEFILKYPRRVYTHLFSAVVTRWLAAILIALNGIDLIAFEASTHNDNLDVKDLSIVFKILVGTFQSLSVRCSGFNIVSISNLRCGLLVLYNAMMYISAYPITITMRSSNVYEERSLGIFSDDMPATLDEGDDDSNNAAGHKKGRTYFVNQQLLSQLGYDALPITLAIIIATFIESKTSKVDEYSVFSIIFEVFSAYCNIGLSIGLPDQNYSLSGSWHPASKLVLIALMLYGRHRTLPRDVDRAVQLPDKNVGSREEEDEHEREHERERVKKMQ